MSTATSSSGGIGLFGMMFIVFLILKLTGYIAWSWWWITAPLWGGFALVFGVLIAVVLGVFGFAGCAVGWDNFKSWRRGFKQQRR